MRVLEWVVFGLMVAAVVALGLFGWALVHYQDGPKGSGYSGPHPDMVQVTDCSDDLTVDGKQFLHRIWAPRADGRCNPADAPVIRADGR